jgi:hypothetical protein
MELREATLEWNSARLRWNGTPSTSTMGGAARSLYENTAEERTRIFSVTRLFVVSRDASQHTFREFCCSLLQATDGALVLLTVLLVTTAGIQAGTP